MAKQLFVFMLMALIAFGGIVHPKSPSAEAGPAYFFEENFDGTTLDSSHWTASTNGSLTVSVSDGSLHMGQGGSSSLDFPYVSSVGTVFPASGNFQVEIVAQYSQHGGQGDGIVVLGPDHEGLFILWGSGLVVALEGTSQVTVVGPLDPHNYRLTYVDGVASIYADNVHILTAPLSARPESLWLGTPTIGQISMWPLWSGWVGIVDGHVDPTTAVVQSRWWYGTNWSPFSIDYIRVSDLPACDSSLSNGLNTCDLQRGDIILSHNIGPGYFMQEALFNGYWTHAGIYVGGGVVVESRGNAPPPSCFQDFSCTTTGPGVESHSIESSSFWTAADWAILRPNATPAQKSAASNYALSQVGKLYNWIYTDKQTTDSFYCSQLVWRAYENYGVDLDSNGSLLGDASISTGWRGPWGVVGTAGILAAVPPDDLRFDNDVSLVKQRTGLVSSLKRTVLRIFSPADFYITDTQGRHTGVDPATHQVVQEIPGVFYGGPDSEPQFISVEDLAGPWQVQTVGTDTGSYTLEAEQIEADHSAASGTGSTTQGEIDSYVARYDQAGQTVQVLNDTDADGVDDQFETSHACLNVSVNDANADPDHDGLSNLTEYRQGRDPCVAEAVGGIAELPNVVASPQGAAESSGPNLVMLMASALMVAVVLGGAAWYARRRR